MKNLFYTFQVSGQITDLTSREIKFNNDYKLLELLSIKSYQIEDEISKLVSYELWKNEVYTKSISIQINFINGSILADGYLILEIMATIGGSISSIELIDCVE